MIKIQAAAIICDNQLQHKKTVYINKTLQLLKTITMNVCRPQRTQTMQKALLKALLPFVAASQDQKSPFLALGRISGVSFSHKVGKERKPRCTVCGAVYQNYFLFLLHIELMHCDQIEVDKYEFSQDLLVIHYKEPGKGSQLQIKYLQRNGNNLFLLGSLQERTKEILARISGKFVKKYTKQKQQYYHSYDIFKEISAQSDGEDSEDDVAYIQRELQKLRIGEFTDINEQDKLFFITWNKMVHQAKKIHVILGREEMNEVLGTFAVAAKKSGLKRLNLVMHGWTLWSSGIIDAQEVLKFLQQYDEHE